MSDLNADARYFDVAELSQLTLTDLQSLWDSVPTDDQTYLAGVFEREADKRGVVEDLDESRMAQHFLEQYSTAGLVPAGQVWVKIPPHIREDYQQDATDEQLTAEDEPLTTTTSTTTFPRWLILLAFPFACLIVFAVVRTLTRAEAPTADIALDTPTTTATITPTPTATPSPSPTPLALSGFDDTIRDGERQRRDYYPVQLQIFPDRNTSPRVFMVQEQAIQVAEWQYTNNPDVVSWLSGMIIKPVLGVPFSPSNLDLFRALNENSVFVVTMNTGAVLQFTYSNTSQIQRSTTALFRQDAPSLVLVLMGETFPDGTPTDLRYVITADYPVEQELGNLQQETVLVPMNETLTIDGATIAVQSAQLLPSDTLPPELAYAVLDLQILTSETGYTLTPILEATAGERLNPDVSASQMGNCAPLEPLSANIAACASVGYIVPRNLTTGRLWLGTTGFAVEFTPPPQILTAADLQVQLGRISYTADELTVQVQLYNPTTQAISISAQDMALVLGLIPNPTGLAISPMLETQTLQPNSELMLEVHFPYNDEAFATLTLFECVWAVAVR